MTSSIDASHRTAAADATPLGPRRPVRVAIAGLGPLGVAHAAVLSTIPDTELVGVADPRNTARDELRGLGFEAHPFARVEKMLAVARPDAVFVCGPQDDRARVATLALEAGAAVLVERPLAHTLEAAEALVRRARELGGRLTCAHDLPHQPVFRLARTLITSGVAGVPRQARASMYVSRIFGPHPASLAPERVAGGVVAHVSCELLLLLLDVLGMPVEVTARWNRLYGGVEDELHAMMRLAGGASVGFDSSWSVPGYPEAATVIELEGDNGKLLASDDALELELIEPRGGFPPGPSVRRLGELPQPAGYDLGGETLYLKDAAFLDWITGGVAPIDEADAALAAYRVMDALYRSARADGAPIAIEGR